MNKKVLLITEGTYPYNYGGVSSWTHTLCNMVSETDFYLYSLNASLELKPKYEVSNNVKEIIQLPLWTPYEPFDFIDYGVSYEEILQKKLATSSKIIKSKFIDTFSVFIENLISDDCNLNQLEKSIYKLYSYFKKYDFKTTLSSHIVYSFFKNLLLSNTSLESSEKINLNDVTFGLRWIYRVLLTLSIPVPKVDITHITLTGFPIIPALIAKKEHGAAIVATEHGIFIREKMIYVNSSYFSFFLKSLMIKCSQNIAKLAYTRSDKVLSVSKFNTKWEFGYGVLEENSKVIYNGIDENRFVPGEKPTPLKNIPTVVAIARIFALKDIVTMIKTCNEVKQTINNIQFIVYGDKNAEPEYTQQCEELIKEFNLENNFVLAGHHSAPNKAFLEGDISILTSISEGFPYTVIESMSCAIPVVATDVGGVAEAITKETGFVCKARDYKALASKVVFLLQNEQLRKKMGENARKRVLEHFTIDKIIKAYQNEYDELIALNKGVYEYLKVV
ncbi:glycosyl transferase [Tenacibaculum holothuriorum]|uniref:Glycosyl transferase n=1 Tax=Tenacibaculum holothuriorum TaxID=1635173 RepID=A0A1Y2PH52_9FLAO|nr:GT4 family glycosyltransferase PelF [Tenacibaculum holothuriorum]OSY89008.1 glycosyl transferase [Tenacibaculum holothuriorum]